MSSRDALVIGLGGNVGTEDEIRARFERARDALAQLGDLRSAKLYRTAPIGPAQGMFLNTAIRVRAADAIPAEVIATVVEIERLLGRDRQRETRWGPRTIDLDVLVWGDRIVREPDLEVPHPRFSERRFALQPMIDLLGEQAIVVGQTLTLGELARRCTGQQLDEIAASW